MADNWLERSDQRKSTLKTCAVELWQKFCTVIDNTCTYFNETHAEKGKLEWRAENGRRIIVSFTLLDPREKTRYVEYRLNESKHCISVTENRSTKDFEIDADIDADKARCFIKSAEGEMITTNDFAELTLKHILFNDPVPPPRKLGYEIKT
jgi:hypothetical protein